MFWKAPVAERVSSIPANEPKVVSTNVTSLAPQIDVSTRVIEMQHRIDEMSDLLTMDYAQQADSQAIAGQIQSVEKKAQWSEALALEVRSLTAKTDALNTELAESKKALAEMKARIAFLHARTNELEQALSDVSSKIGPIEDTMRTLRMGNFEYYTVHPGDTCKSIAAQPFIYGDESKHTLIRQANRGQVTDLDHLTPGESLIIPRPKGETLHEF